MIPPLLYVSPTLRNPQHTAHGRRERRVRVYLMITATGVIEDTGFPGIPDMAWRAYRKKLTGYQIASC